MPRKANARLESRVYEGRTRPCCANALWVAAVGRGRRAYRRNELCDADSVQLSLKASVTLTAALTATLLTERIAQAQSPPLCVPGTTVCASGDGKGGVRVDANGNAQAGPGGASATGQANAQGNGAARGNANANANAGGGARASGGSSRRRSLYNGRFGAGVVGCPVVRAGIWSGFKAGGCIGVSFRWEALTFEMETQLLYGGTTHAFDWTFPLSFIVPLDNQQSLFAGPYLRFGGSPVGATFARKQDGGNFVRFGLFAGAGYEMLLGDRVTWRVIDARLSFDMGTKRAMDRLDHWVDLGAQLSTGIVL